MLRKICENEETRSISEQTGSKTDTTRCSAFRMVLNRPRRSETGSILSHAKDREPELGHRNKDPKRRFPGVIQLKLEQSNKCIIVVVYEYKSWDNLDASDRGREAFDLVLAFKVQEPNKNKAKGSRWLTEQDKDVGICFRNKRCGVKGYKVERGFIKLEFPEMMIYIRYVSPNFWKVGLTRDVRIEIRDLNSKLLLLGGSSFDGKRNTWWNGWDRYA